jgi:hypothetical protein
MDIFSLLLLIFLSYRNGLKAKTKGLNGIVWGIITFFAIFITEMIGAAIVIFYFCRNIINVERLATDPSYKDTAVQQLGQEFINNPLDPITIILFGIGGYLIVRFILDKKPGKQDTPPHWSDKLGENRDN